jgi:VanZ family protein
VPDRHRAAAAVTARRRRLTLWGPAVAYAAAIFVASSFSRVPEPPGGLTDKHVHVAVYAGLAILILRALAGGHWRAATAGRCAAAAVLAVLYGGSDEWHQSFVPGRSADRLDLAADAAGAVGAAGLAWMAARLGRGGPDGRIEQAGAAGQGP